MPTVRDRILEYLKAHPQGADDTELTSALGLKNHAQANLHAHELERMGLVVRRRGTGNILNVYTGEAAPHPATQAPAPLPEPPASPAPQPDRRQSWFWEGNVQSAVIHHLVMHGYKIMYVADTASHQAGKDIVAAKDGRTLWVTVKGYPTGTDKTNASTQARIWFSGAIFDIVVWHGEDANVDLAVALPDYPTYRHLAERVRWLQPVAHFAFLWVAESGEVESG
jgi:hypothetical protein